MNARQIARTASPVSHHFLASSIRPHISSFGTGVCRPPAPTCRRPQQQQQGCAMAAAGDAGGSQAAAAAAAAAAEQSTRTPAVIHFATGNKKKLEEVVAILAAGAELPFAVQPARLELPELQGEPEDISREKARIAAQQLGAAVMVEDTSLCFNALHGLPGPYIKWFLEKLGHDGLNRMLAGFDDKTAYAQCIFAYTPGPGVEPLTFVGRTPGRIVPAAGPPDFGWDPIFQPDGFKETYAQMDKDVKNTISHRYRALDKLRAHLLQRC